MIRRSGDSRLSTSLLRLASLAPYRFFVCPTFLPWEPEGDWRQIIRLSPSCPESALWLCVKNLYTVRSQMSQYFGCPGHISWPESYLEFLWGICEISVFRRKGKAARFPKVASLCLQTNIPSSFWRVVTISTQIGLYVPPWRNFLGVISLLFCLSYKFSALMSTYVFLDNHAWARFTQ